MIWIATSENDTAAAALKKRLWDATEQAAPASVSGLKSLGNPGGRPRGLLGLIFRRFAEVRFAAQRAEFKAGYNVPS